MSGYQTILRKVGRIHVEEKLRFGPLCRLFEFLFGDAKWDGVPYTLSFAKHALQIAYAVCALTFFLSFQSLGYSIGIIIILSVLVELSFRLFGTQKSALYLHIFSPLMALLLILISPFGISYWKIFEMFEERKSTEAPSAKQKLLEAMYESTLGDKLDAQDQKLIVSLALFKERIVKEIMVPRIDVLILPIQTTIQEAAEKFITERYSRVPIYKDNVDQIVGVLLYKDILNIYIKAKPEELHKSIEGILKPVLYAPETKKISQLLQEFRMKQIHLAIVVDEYGGTEGIVTFEDILEELVGEIADEHDIAEDMLYSITPSGDWIVDARMGILDIEKEIEISIPRNPDYDTIGGYAFHCAGMIPPKGWKIHHDEFELEIINSTERSVEKILIRPTKKKLFPSKF